MPSQVPHGRHSWESTIRRSGHTTSFGAAAHPHDTSANGSYELYKPENAAIYSNLVRRSRSLTDADMASIDAGLQPPGRRRSFFSPRKPKAAPDPSPNQSSLTPTPRSLSGLLPSHLGREDSGSLLDSDRDGAKSFTSKDNRVVDTDSTAGNAKSAKWWSWGGSRAPLKPDAKLMPAACQNSVGLDSLPHSVFAGMRQLMLPTQACTSEMIIAAVICSITRTSRVF